MTKFRFAAALACFCLMGWSSVEAGVRVRVAHLSPDAPAVDVRVDGLRIYSGVEFGEVSDYTLVAAGTYKVEVTPAGAMTPVVISADLELENNTSYTIAATGLLGDEDLAPVVIVDDTEVVDENVRLRFIHASPDAPAVDIAVVGGDPVFANVSFREISDVVEIPAGDYDLEVRLAGTDTVVLSLGTVTLDGSTNLSFFAAGLVGNETLGATAAVNASSSPEPALVRVAHLSPDAPNVDVWVDGARALMDVPFTAVSDYLALSAGPHRFQVTPAGAETPVVIDATVELAGGTAYTVAATGLLGDEDLSPIVLTDDLDADAENAKVRFVHTSPDAPAVDIAVTGGPVLIENVSFRETGTPISVPTGVYDLEVRVAGTETVALPLPGVALNAGINYTVFAIGLLSDETLGALPTVDIDETFLRGDANRDGEFDITDPIATLKDLFLGRIDFLCRDAADTDDDGHVTLTDAVISLDYLFRTGPTPAAPFPMVGTDLTEDGLSCTPIP